MNVFIFGESGPLLNHDVYYQLNVNVDQSTRALPIICTCKNVISMDFSTKPMDEMPTLILCELYLSHLITI